MQEMTFNQLLFIALIPLLSVPFIIGVMLLVSKGTLKMDTLLEGLRIKRQKASRKLSESGTSLAQESAIDIDFIPNCFFENIKTDKSRPRREWILMSIGFLALTYHYSKHFHEIHNEDIIIFAIYFCLTVVAVKATSFSLDMRDIDHFITRELNNKYAAKKYSFVGWQQLGSRFTYINIALLLILLAGEYFTYLYLTRTRLIIAMAALFVFAITRLVKFRAYIRQMYNLYDTLAQSDKPVSPDMRLFNFSKNIIEATGIGMAITLILYLLSIDTLPIRLLMYVISFGFLYFASKSLYVSRSLFYKALIDIDNYRKHVS